MSQVWLKKSHFTVRISIITELCCATITRNFKLLQDVNMARTWWRRWCSKVTKHLHSLISHTKSHEILMCHVQITIDRWMHKEKKDTKIQCETPYLKMSDQVHHNFDRKCPLKRTNCTAEITKTKLSHQRNSDSHKMGGGSIMLVLAIVAFVSFVIYVVVRCVGWCTGWYDFDMGLMGKVWGKSSYKHPETISKTGLTSLYWA